MSRLRTAIGEELYESFREPLRRFLRDVDANIGAANSSPLSALRAILELTRRDSGALTDEVHDDLFVLDRYVDFFENYGLLWQLIANAKFAESWSKLQDTLDVLRLVRKFSRIDISALEDQVLELEKTYPYGVFFSIAALVGTFECSICGHDIDGAECSHRRGGLYRGQMAVAIARKVENIDHIALVDEPRDRRCVVQYEDTGEQFKLVRLLSDLLRRGEYKVSDFGVLQFSKRLRPDPNYRRLGRNEPCFCGSGLKFKRCCIERLTVEGDHVDIAPRRITAERAVA